MPQIYDRLPRDDEDFHAFINRIHPKCLSEMTRKECADWYGDCVDWAGAFAFRDAAKGKEGK